MKSSTSSRRLTLLAILFVSSLFASTFVAGDRSHSTQKAPLGISGTAVILQADGGAPLPPPPPPKQTTVSASLA